MCPGWLKRNAVRRRVVAALAMAGGAAGAGGAAASVASQPGPDGWPDRPITYVVPFPPGGTTDTLARMMVQRLGAALGQPVVLENLPGAGGNVGSIHVARARPDGYTFLGGTISSHAINAAVYPGLQHDVVRSFEAVTLIGTYPNVLVVTADSPYRSVRDLVEAARAKPGSIPYASAGNGTSQQLCAELFKQIARIDLTHMPYKGSGPALRDMMAGKVPVAFESTVVAQQFVDSGRLRPLAVTGRSRVRSMPDVPTMVESGVPGFDVMAWQGVFAPAHTSKAIVGRFAAAVARVIAEPDMSGRMAHVGMKASGMAPKQFAAFQKAEVQRWARVVRSIGMRVD